MQDDRQSASSSTHSETLGNDAGVKTYTERHIPALDGIRGLAILLVLFVHFLPDYLMPTRATEWAKKLAQCGWVGVDLFFVLSGYLITGILLSGRNRPHKARNFYMRRVLRIFPLYVATLLLVFVVLPFVVPRGADPGFDRMRDTQLWYWLHCANLLTLFHGFGAMNSDTVNLAHFWSLAVEEHFYLIWPAVVWAMPERRLVWAATAMIVTAPLLRIAMLTQLEGSYLVGIYVLMPARMDALAVGAILAILSRRLSPAVLRSAAWVVLPLCTLPLVADFYIEKGLWVSSTFVRTAGQSLLAFAFGAIIVIAVTGRPESFGGRLIDNRALRFLGRYSYGIYVLHAVLEPMMDRWISNDAVLTACGSPLLAAPVVFAAKSAISVSAAMVSWVLIERPCLALKRYFPRTDVVT